MGLDSNAELRNAPAHSGFDLKQPLSPSTQPPSPCNSCFEAGLPQEHFQGLPSVHTHTDFPRGSLKQLNDLPPPHFRLFSSIVSPLLLSGDRSGGFFSAYLPWGWAEDVAPLYLLFPSGM